jgi:hypothetical protein
MIVPINETHDGVLYTHRVLVPDMDDGEQTWDLIDEAWSWIRVNTPGARKRPVGMGAAYPIVINLDLDPVTVEGWANSQEYWIGFTCYEDAFAFLMRFG